MLDIQMTIARKLAATMKAPFENEEPYHEGESLNAWARRQNAAWQAHMDALDALGDSVAEVYRPLAPRQTTGRGELEAVA